MIIYKDYISGDELFSDTYPLKYVGGGALVRVQGELSTFSNSVDESKFGANASAEEPGEGGADDGSTSGVDIVMANRLVEVNPFKLKEYKPKIKEYVTKLTTMRTKEIETCEEEGESAAVIDKMKEELADFKKSMGPALKEFILTPWKEKEFQFFLGESLDNDAMVPLLTYEDDKPCMYFFAYGLKEMKV